MSHKTEVKTKLDNLSYIKKSLDNLGYKYKEAKEGEKLTTRGSYGVHEKVDILITEVKGRNCNDAIGLQQQADGSYVATGDFWGTGVNAQQLGKELTVEAKKEETNDRLMALGFQLDQTTDAKGEIELTFTRWV